MAAGVYEIVDRGGRKTAIAYKLEIPQEPGEVQKELQIRQEASYTLSIKVQYCLSLKQSQFLASMQPCYAFAMTCSVISGPHGVCA